MVKKSFIKTNSSTIPNPYAIPAAGHSYNGQPRYYRHAITAAEHAARHFEDQKVQCVLNLGDIIDGKCVDVEKYGGLVDLNDSGSVGHQAVDDVLKALSCYTNGRIIHTYGEFCQMQEYFCK